MNGYPEYQVNNFGKIRSLKNNKIKEIKQTDNNYGYLCATLCSNGKLKTEKVHRIVAKTFIPNPNNLLCVNHKDENKYNNCVDNLEWCNHYYNNHYGKRTKKVKTKLAKKVRQYDLKGNFIKEYESTIEVERQLGYFQSSISNCCNNKRKTAYGFKWKYVNEEEKAYE